MSTELRKRAAGKHRARLAQRGIKRFEMMAPETDGSLFRTLESGSWPRTDQSGAHSSDRKSTDFG